MKNGYRIEWTDNALDELRKTYEYLEANWTKKELKNLSSEIDRTINLISTNPNLFPKSKKNVRRAVLKKLNTIYYRETTDNRIEILSFFSNRQNSNKHKI